MLRNAADADIPRLMEIRNGVRENVLRDPSRVTLEDYRWFVGNPGIFVWVEDDRIVGFSAADPRDGSIWALFVDQAYERRGVARALLERTCQVLDEAGCPRVWLTTSPHTRAEQFYRKAGWRVTGSRDGDLIFERLSNSSPTDQARKA